MEAIQLYDAQSPARESVIELISDGAVSQAQVAREAGVSTSALSQWMSGNYRGDNAALEAKIEKWLRQRQAQEAATLPEPPEWVDTPTGEKIMAVLSYAQIAGDISCVYGSAGIGKTKTCERYQAENPSVWMATMTTAHAGAGACLEEVAISIGMRTIPFKAARMFREICARVRDTRGLLIIDEAQHLSPAALESLRAIHDATGIGLVLAGNEMVYARLTGGARTAKFAQLYSRVGKRLRITRPLKADVMAMAAAFGITGGKEREACWVISKKGGALRQVVKTLRLAAMIATGNGAQMNINHIRAAWDDLKGGE